MKKLMLAAMAALAITGCSQNEEFEAVSQKAPIGFNTVVSKTTRAAITELAALRTSGFTVYAYTSPEEITTAFPSEVGTLMTAEAVTYDEATTSWKNTKEYYWPLTNKVHFYAYATGAGANYIAPTTSKYPGLNYTVADLADKQKDFVVAKLQNQGKSDNAIQLSFAHALTQVNFSAVGDKAGFTYTVNSIKIVNVAKTGIYSFSDGQWTTEAPFATSYEYPINSANKAIDGIVSKDLDVTDNTLMLMPQAMNADAKIVISYTVSDATGVVYATDENGFEISLAGKIDWEPGKKVRYTLTLGNGAVSMKFAPVVGPWGNQVNGQDPKPVE